MPQIPTRPERFARQAGAGRPRIGPDRRRRRISTLFLTLCLTFGASAVLAQTPLAVEIVTAKAMANIHTISLTGEIVARDTLAASFPAGGRIAEVFVEEGDAVARDAPLAQMESVQQEQALLAAEAGSATAEADYRQAIEDFERQGALLARGATTRINRDTAEDALRIAEGGLAQARAELDRARKALSDTVLLAPLDAVVTDRLVEPGQVVGAAQPVLELALGGAFDAVFDVPEALLISDQPAPEVDLTLLDNPAIRFTGFVREVSPLVEAGTGTVSVRIGIGDPPDALSYGDAVRGSVTNQEAPRVFLPYTAVTATADGPAVWVADPDTMRVETRPVTIERYETGQVILAGGIADGTLVVTEGAQLLWPGRVVRPAEVTQ